MAEPGLTPCPRLERGDKVAVIAASGPVEASRLQRALDALNAYDLDPVVLPSARATTDPLDGGYLAGSDTQRGADLTAALGDPAYRAVLCARGGYGAQRTLECVDWDAIDPKRPRVEIGRAHV